MEFDRKSDADLCNTVYLNVGLLQKELSDDLKAWFVLWLSAGQCLQGNWQVSHKEDVVQTHYLCGATPIPWFART